MGKITKLRDLIGTIKDKASQSKAALLTSRRNSTVSFHLAVLRATSHSAALPPADHHLAAILTIGDSSIATASALVDYLMDRLHKTTDSSVALKCLLALHHIIRRGPFILQDQLSFIPAGGGHNFLKLSSFKDGATNTTWALSLWVRWYALYLETLLSTFRVLGFFFLSSSSSHGSGAVKQNVVDRFLSMSNANLMKELESLLVVIEEICKLPDSVLFEGYKLLYEVKILVGSDYLPIVNEILSRFRELKERLSSLNFAENVELMYVLKRIEECKERLMEIFIIKKPSIKMLWELITELKEKARYEGKLLTWEGRGENDEESTQFSDSVKVSSGKFDINHFSLVMISGPA